MYIIVYIYNNIHICIDCIWLYIYVHIWHTLVPKLTEWSVTSGPDLRSEVRWAARWPGWLNPSSSELQVWIWAGREEDQFWASRNINHWKSWIVWYFFIFFLIIYRLWMSYWCVLRREFLGMIHVIKSNFIIPATPIPIPYVKRTSKWEMGRSLG